MSLKSHNFLNFRNVFIKFDIEVPLVVVIYKDDEKVIVRQLLVDAGQDPNQYLI